METLADLVARDRRSDRPALRTPSREMDYRRVCTTAYKAGNFLSHCGVGDRLVAVADDPRPQAVLTFLGAALLAAPTRFARRPETVPEARVVLVPAEREGDVEDVPGRVRVVYGDSPTAATTRHWEEDVWSENPAFPPSAAALETPALVGAERTWTHGEVLAGARDVVDELDVGRDDDVRLAGGLADPRSVVAGVIAPLLAGATAVLEGGAGGDSDGDTDRGGVVRVDGRELHLSDVG